MTGALARRTPPANVLPRGLRRALACSLLAAAGCASASAPSAAPSVSPRAPAFVKPVLFVFAEAPAQEPLSFTFRVKRAPARDLASEIAAEGAGRSAPAHVVVVVPDATTRSGGEEPAISAGALIRALQRRLPHQTEPTTDQHLAFVSFPWAREGGASSLREAALRAELAGAERLGPALAAMRAALPQSRVTLIGHGLGGRVVLSALEATQLTRAGLQAVLLTAAADVDALNKPPGPAGSGAFPSAARRLEVLLNVHSSAGDGAYAAAFQAPSIGVEGVQRAPGRNYATVPFSGGEVPPGRLQEALAHPAARMQSGARVLNVDASAVLATPTDVFAPNLLELIAILLRRP